MSHTGDACSRADHPSPPRRRRGGPGRSVGGDLTERPRPSEPAPAEAAERTSLGELAALFVRLAKRAGGGGGGGCGGHAGIGGQPGRADFGVVVLASQIHLTGVHVELGEGGAGGPGAGGTGGLGGPGPRRRS